MATRRWPLNKRSNHDNKQKCQENARCPHSSFLLNKKQWGITKKGNFMSNKPQITRPFHYTFDVELATELKSPQLALILKFFIENPNKHKRRDLLITFPFLTFRQLGVALHKLEKLGRLTVEVKKGCAKLYSVGGLNE